MLFGASSDPLKRCVQVDSRPKAAKAYVLGTGFGDGIGRRLASLGNDVKFRPRHRPSRLARRIAAFVASGLDDHRIRARTVIRGVYLRNERDYAKRIRALLD